MLRVETNLNKCGHTYVAMNHCVSGVSKCSIRVGYRPMPMLMPIMREFNGTEPEFEATEDYLMSNLFNNGHINEPDEPKHDPKTQDNDSNKGHIDPKTDPKTVILTLITKNPSITYTELAFSIDKSPATVKRYLQELKASGVVSRIGGRKGGRWSVK